MTLPQAGGAPARAPETKSAHGPSGGLIALHSMMEAGASLGGYAGASRAGFMRNPIMHRCVRLISEAAASVPWLLYEGIGRGGAEHDAHPILELLARPNPRQPGAAFMETVYGHLLLGGNAFVEAVTLAGEPRELYALRPDRVEVHEDARGWPEAFEIRSGSARRRVAVDADGMEPILHLALFHPLDDSRGPAPADAALGALDVHNAADRWNKALLDNAARPSGALVYAPKEGGNLSEDQFDRLKTELESGYAGATNAGRPMLLEGGLDWKAMSLSPQEMDFIEAKNGASRDIALAFGVPPMLLGIPGDNTYANYAEANRAFLRLTVLPLVARTAAALGAWLGQAWGGGLRLDYDIDRIEGLSVEREALWARLEDASFLTRAEKREAVGYAPDDAHGPIGDAHGPIDDKIQGGDQR